MDTTGNRIKNARLAAKMTQGELASKVGVKHAAIYKYENGLVVNLKRETIEKLANALRVRPSYLLCIDDEPQEPSQTVSPAKQMLLDATKDLSDEQVLKLLNIIEEAKKLF